MEFLYQSDGQYYFMNVETYDQLPLDEETLGEGTKYLIPNLRLMVEFHEGQPVAVDLPKTVDMKVVDTAPGMKGATATNQLKPATTETGLVVNVPPFIDVDDVIRVDTETGAYLSRAK
jgi:elongation factor P